MPDKSFDSVIPCMTCQHLTAIGNNKSKKGWKCKAFPNGIPEIILNRNLDHKTILDIYPGQVMPYLYKGAIYGNRVATYDGSSEELNG